MIEKRCKICGEWFNSRKIAMHYWNIHKEKYNKYKGADEETREVVEAITDPKDINQEEYVLETSKNDYTAFNKAEIENEKKANTETETNTETQRRDFGDEESVVINEVFRPYHAVVKNDILEEGEVINEWC